MANQSIIESRTRRLLANIQHNRVQLVVDIAILLTWIIISVAVFRWLLLPQWLHYLVLFIGIAVYNKLTPNWERPYRSPD